MKTYFLPLIFLSLMLSFIGCSSQRPQNASQNTSNENPRPKTTKPVVVRASIPERDAAEPAVAVDEQGRAYVLYVEHGTDKSGDLYLQRLGTDLNPDSAQVRINPNPGEVKAWRGDPPTVKVGANGKVYAGWNRLVKTGDGAPANDLMLSVSSDGGKTFAAPVKINDDTVPASHGMHAMSVAGDGGENIYFTWLDERYLKKEKHGVESKGGEMHHGEAEPNAELYFAASKDGGRTFSANKKIAADICPCCKAQMTAAKDGRVYISWRQVLPGEFRHVAITSTGDGGETFAGPTIVNDDKWHITACPVSGAPMAVADDGTLRVAWYTAGDAGSQGLYWSESKDSGKTFSPRSLISEGAIMGTSLLLAGNSGDSGNSGNSGKADDQKVIWVLDGKMLWKDLSGANAASDTGEFSEGELPSAARYQDSVYIAFLKKEGEKRSIWLLASKN